MGETRFMHEAGTSNLPQYCRRCGDEVKYDTAYAVPAGRAILDVWDFERDPPLLLSREVVDGIPPDDVPWCDEVERVDRPPREEA